MIVVVQLGQSRLPVPSPSLLVGLDRPSVEHKIRPLSAASKLTGINEIQNFDSAEAQDLCRRLDRQSSFRGWAYAISL
jgi:hypothetical protein